jgi:hypothetical protein
MYLESTAEHAAATDLKTRKTTETLSKQLSQFISPLLPTFNSGYGVSENTFCKAIIHIKQFLFNSGTMCGRKRRGGDGNSCERL